MADESDWQNHVDSVQRGTVTANVNARRYGEMKGFAAAGASSASDTKSENEQAAEEGYADKWQKRFDHLPGVSKE